MTFTTLAVVSDSDPVSEKVSSTVFASDLEDNGDLPTTEHNPGRDESPSYPSGFPLALTLTSSALAMFLISLDRTIIATAIPTITNEFNSIDDIAWYATSYMLTNCASQLVFGKLYTLYSTKTTFLLSVLLFEIGSLISGVAPSSPVLITGRSIAGLGASGISSGSMMILVHSLPLHKRPLYSAMFVATVGIASILGPVLGGVLTSKASWRWCFYINLPVGVVTIPIILLYLKTPPPPPTSPTKFSTWTTIQRLDPLGTLLFLPSIALLILALQWSGSNYWSSPKIIITLTLSLTLLLAFILTQHFLPPLNATLPLPLLRNRTILSSLLLQFFSAGSTNILTYYLPIYFQSLLSFSALNSGLAILPTVLAMILGAFSGATLTKKTGYYVPSVWITAIVSPIGMGLLTLLSAHTTRAKWIGYQVLYGFGQGSSMQVATLAAQTVLPSKEVPVGIGMMFFMQQLGAIVFVAVGENVFLGNLRRGLVDVVGVDVGMVMEVGVEAWRGVVGVEMWGSVEGVYVEALRVVWWVSLGCVSVVFLAAGGMEWRSVREGEGKELVEEVYVIGEKVSEEKVGQMKVE